MNLITMATFAAISISQQATPSPKQSIAKTFVCAVSDALVSPIGDQFELTLTGEVPVGSSDGTFPFPVFMTVGDAKLTSSGDDMDDMTVIGSYTASLITEQTRLAGFFNVSVGVGLRALTIDLSLILDPQLQHAFGYGTVDRVDHGHHTSTILVSCK